MRTLNFVGSIIYALIVAPFTVIAFVWHFNREFADGLRFGRLAAKHTGATFAAYEDGARAHRTFSFQNGYEFGKKWGRP